MGRPKRADPAGIACHILNRATGGAVLFQDEDDYRLFESLLADTVTRLGIELVGWCLLPDQWHLVLRPAQEGQIAAALRRLSTLHSQRWRQRRGTVGQGPLYQGRYKAFLVQDGPALRSVLGWVEAAPKRAGLAVPPATWAWSSARGASWARLELEPPAGRVQAGSIDPDRLIPPVELQRLVTSFERGRPFGDPAWVEAIVERFDLRSTVRAPGRPRKASAEPSAPVEPLRPRGVGRGRSGTRPHVRRPERGPGRDKPGA